KASDGTTSSSPATVTITVNPVNDPPVAGGASYAINEDNVLTVAAPGVLTNAMDVDGDPLTAVLFSAPTHGVLTLNCAGSSSYQPNTNFTHTTIFPSKASDGTTSSSPATVTITVNPVNDPPVAGGASFAINEDNLLTVAAPGVLTNAMDVDGDPLTAVLSTAPTHGVLTLNGDGSFSYQPNTNFNGTDSFTYKASDGKIGTASCRERVTVTPV